MHATGRFSITQRLSVLRLSSIRNKILMLAILGTLLPSLTTTWISYTETRESLQAKASEELQSVSTQTARELELWAKERRYDLRVFASSYEVTENLERIVLSPRQSVHAERLTDYLNSVRERFTDYQDLLIVDMRGKVVSGTQRGEAMDMPDDWQARMRGDNVVLGAPYWNKEEKQSEMVIAVPITVSGGQLLGALVAKVNLQLLAPTLERFAPGEEGQVYLVTRQGNVIVGSRGMSMTTMSLHYGAQITRSLVQGEGKPLELTNVFNQQVLGSMRIVPGLDWVVVAEIPSDEVFRQLAHLRNVTLLIVLGMLGVAGGLGYALGLFIVRPLDVLTRGAAKVAGGDLDVDLPVAKGGEVAYLTEVFNNMVARLRASRSELERLSVTDDLTGLNNRRRMMETLHNEVRRSRRLKHSFVIIMADVDHFKRYNDEHGHPAGDDVLMRVAAVFGEATRDVDFVARYGGEEFFVLMPEVGTQAGIDMANKIRQRLALENFPGGRITLSFGVAEFPLDGASGEALIAVADAALYQAKRKGRDQVITSSLADRAKASGQ
jgi:diguanylate cyclase (GGDEF)-like protein